MGRTTRLDHWSTRVVFSTGMLKPKIVTKVVNCKFIIACRKVVKSIVIPNAVISPTYIKQA